MSDLRVRFVWGQPPVTPARWHLALMARRVRPGRRHDGWLISVRGVLLWLAGLALAGYLAATTALWIWLDNRPFNQVTWTDAVLAPVRWEQIREKRGLAYIEEGMADFRSQQWAEGVLKLRVGLQRHPDHWRARLHLVEFYLAVGAREQANAMVSTGLEFSYPGRAEFQRFLNLWGSGEEYGLARAAIERTLTHDDRQVETDRDWLREQAAQFGLRQGDSAAVLSWADTRPISDQMAGELRLLALIAEGRADEALAWADEWKAQGGEPGRVARLEVRAAREAGDLTRLEQAWETLRRLTPAQPHPYVFGVVQRALAGDPHVRDSLDDYLFRFGSRVDSLDLIVEPLGQIARFDLLAIVKAWAEAHGLQSEVLQRSTVQIRLTQGDWAGAAQALRALEDWREAQQQRAISRPQGSRAPTSSNAGALMWEKAVQQTLVFLLDPSEGHQQALVDWVRSNARGLPAYRLVLGWLEQAEHWQAARTIVGLAQRHFPDHAGLREQRERYETALAGQSAREEREHEFMRDPDAPTINWLEAWRSDVTVLPEGETQVLEEIDRLLAAGEGGATLQLIRQVRLSRPAWLPRRSEELLRAEIRAQILDGDRGALASTVRRFLDGGNSRGLEAMRFVEELDAVGRREDARAVLAEVLRSVPGFPPALRQQARWTEEEAPAAVTPEAGR